MTNAGGAHTLEQGIVPSEGDSGTSSGFRPPRRRRKTLLWIAIVVIGVVVFLVYLMARGPDTERVANSLVESTLAALPAGALSASDVGKGAQGLQRALNIHATSDVAIEAQGLLMQRVAEQVETDIVQGELDRADEALTEASVHWTGEDDFADDGRLRKGLQDALEQRALMNEVTELVAAAEERLTPDPEGGEAIREALDLLRRSLDLDPENGRAQSIRDGIRRDVKTATRKALDAREPQRASRLLDAVEGEWGGDSELARLRGEVKRQVEELDRALETRRLLDLAERRLRADMLTTPASDSAADYFRRVLAMDAGNAAAKEGIGRIGDRYVVLISKAVETGVYDRARRMLGSFEALSPEHPQIAPLRARIETGERVAAAASSAKPSAEAAAPSAQVSEKHPDATPTEIPTDDEGRLWYEVKDSCVETDIRRYMESYPAGRYIDEAWRNISSCLETR